MNRIMSYKVKLFSLKISASGSNQREDKPKEDRPKEDKVKVPSGKEDSGKETNGRDILKAIKWMSVESLKGMAKEVKYKSWK